MGCGYESPRNSEEYYELFLIYKIKLICNLKQIQCYLHYLAFFFYFFLVHTHTHSLCLKIKIHIEQLRFKKNDRTLFCLTCTNAITRKYIFIFIYSLIILVLIQKYFQIFEKSAAPNNIFLKK